LTKTVLVGILVVVNSAFEKPSESKVLLDPGIAQSLDDFKSGRSHGPFKTHQNFLASLHSQTKRLQSMKTKRLASRLGFATLS